MMDRFERKEKPLYYFNSRGVEAPFVLELPESIRCIAPDSLKYHTYLFCYA